MLFGSMIKEACPAATNSIVYVDVTRVSPCVISILRYLRDLSKLFEPINFVQNKTEGFALTPQPSDLREFTRGSMTSVYAVYNVRDYVTGGHLFNVQANFAESGIAYKSLKPPVIDVQRFQSGS